MSWSNASNIGSRSFRCGFCGNRVASAQGYFLNDPSVGTSFIFVCPHCESPTYFDTWDSQHPGVAPGNSVENVPHDLDQLYNEARDCVAASANTAAVLACRKLLMHIAVEQGAQPGLKFIEYVEYLAANGFVPPNSKGWVDHIRKKGNEANHEIILMTADDATDLISFSEMLLKFLYEFPAKVPPT